MRSPRGLLRGLPLSCSAQIVRAKQSEMPAWRLTRQAFFIVPEGRRDGFIPGGMANGF
ncbi:exported hypothetical protein [Klebsiella variicola]|nr:exported hypothetical protein [Klebsiella variicola]